MDGASCSFCVQVFSPRRGFCLHLYSIEFLDHLVTPVGWLVTARVAKAARNGSQNNCHLAPRQVSAPCFATAIRWYRSRHRRPRLEIDAARIPGCEGRSQLSKGVKGISSNGGHLSSPLASHHSSGRSPTHVNRSLTELVLA